MDSTIQEFKINGNESISLQVIPDKKDVFISYKRENAPFVSRVANELEAHLINVWFDQKSCKNHRSLL